MMTAAERAQRVLDRCPPHPSMLTADDQLRVLHELLHGDVLEAEELRAKLSEAERRIKLAEDEALAEGDAANTLRDRLGKISAQVRLFASTLDGVTLDAAQRAELAKLRDLCGLAKQAVAA